MRVTLHLDVDAQEYDTLHALLTRARQAQEIDVVVRQGTRDYYYQADWFTGAWLTPLRLTTAPGGTGRPRRTRTQTRGDRTDATPG